MGIQFNVSIKCECCRKKEFFVSRNKSELPNRQSVLKRKKDNGWLFKDGGNKALCPDCIERGETWSKLGL